MSTYRTDPHLAKPTPAHSLTPEAEVARGTVRDLPPQRVVRDGGVVGLTRKPLTRAEVVLSYEHPAPEILGYQLEWSALPPWNNVIKFCREAEAAGADLRFTFARGMTPPRWRVPADTPVAAEDYHGDLVDSLVVWAVRGRISTDGVTGDGRRFGRAWLTEVRAEWHDGRSQGATINGVKATLRDALEALR